MPVEMGIWRIDGDTPRRLGVNTLPTEAMLEDFLEKDPTLLGERLMVIGRQVRTPYWKYIDLLAMDSEGNLHVLELKRDKTPRDVVAQALDYGSWIKTLGRDEIIEIANGHLKGVPFEVAFQEAFGGSPPDELNDALQLTIVATDLDASSERIVNYLREFGVPINAVFFAFHEDDGRRYLARSWLATEEEAPRSQAARRGKRADWNQRDWFVSFGEEAGSRSWSDGRRLGFVSAGGDPWYSNTLKSLPVGARINVHIPRRGYVAVGETLAEARRFDEALVELDGEWMPLADQPGLIGQYRHGEEGTPVTDNNAEYVVPVRWLRTAPAEDAYWEKGMFANQNSACKLRQEFTLERLGRHFGVSDDESDQD